MQRIALKQAAPGMILAQPVTRDNGQVLIGEGVRLSDNIIDRIRASGIGTIVVEGNPLGAAGTVGNIQTIADHLGHSFRRHKTDIFMMTLHNMLKRYFAHRIAEQRAMEEAAIGTHDADENAENPDTDSGATS